MKKLLIPILVVVLMLTSVSTVFAKGGPPVGKGLGRLKQQDQTLKTTGKPEVVGNPEKGKPDKNRNNFVLFGTLEEVTAADGDTPASIKVTVLSGNNLIQSYDYGEGEANVLTIEVPDGTKIKTMEPGKAKWITAEELTNETFTGSTVRVHGWWTPDEATPETVTTEVTGDETAAKYTGGTFTATQLYAWSDISTDEDTEAPETD